MPHHVNSKSCMIAVLALGVLGCDPAGDDPVEFRSATSKYNTGARNLHLQSTVRTNPTQPGADADRGRRLFGLAADLDSSDSTEALFEGDSVPFGGTVVSNGRTCFSCHRGTSEQLGLPPPPLSDHISLEDPLFTAFDADAQGDPDGFFNLDQLGLVKYRPNRFNPKRDQSDPFRQAFAWRKSIPLVNTGLTVGFLNDMRGRVMFETARGAVFSHTQASDDRFDDLFTLEDGADMEAFLFGAATLTDPTLAALRDRNDPMYDVLVDEPFYTVALTTKAEKRGKKVFVRDCMGCHNMPNVFGNMDNVEALGNGDRPPNFPSWAPAVGRAFNVGVGERNVHGLRFTRDAGEGSFEPIVLPLANEDGTTNMHEIAFDIGLAMTTGRTDDIGRFKVPQLRGVKNNGPYFHDNSAATLEDVVEYFNSDDYNESKDGVDAPISQTDQEKADLLAFLNAL